MKALLIMLVVSLSALAVPSSAQRLPKIRVLRSDEPASTSRGGCDNHPMSFTKDGDDMFFDSHNDGLDAWMNLDGHNVRLRLRKSTYFYRDDYGTADATYVYRYRAIVITVRLPLLSDYTLPQPATVIVSNGKARRKIRAFVAPQCDAI